MRVDCAANRPAYATSCRREPRPRDGRRVTLDRYTPGGITPAMDSSWRTAVSATLHCLTGCAIGEVLGMVLATWWGWSNGPEHRARRRAGVLLRLPAHSASVLRAGLGAAYGGHGRARRRHRLDPGHGGRRQPGAAVSCPVRWTPACGDLLFWGSLAFSLAVAFVVTVPVNRAMIARGKGHAVVHASTTPRWLRRARGSCASRWYGMRHDRGMSYALGQGTGPLRGVRVVEIAGIGPGPHAATILADLGADVIRVERPGRRREPGHPRDRPADPRPAERRAGPEAPRGRRGRARARRERRRAARGDAARRDRAARASAPTSAWPATRGWSTGG